MVSPSRPVPAPSAPAADRQDWLLSVEDLEVSYGKAPVVHGVSFGVRAGEFVALLGRNGAGKSSTLHAVCGLIGKRAGRVRFGGADVTHATPERIVALGLVPVLEGHRVFPSLTVEDNLLVATYAGRSGEVRQALDRVYAVFPELAARRRQPASRLSGGQQQILAVGQGIIADPRLLILDEPSGGLAPIVVDRILEVAADLCRAGAAVILVEQLVDKALRHADQALVMETGRLVRAVPAADLRGSDVLHEIYLGAATAGAPA